MRFRDTTAYGCICACAAAVVFWWLLAIVGCTATAGYEPTTHLHFGTVRFLDSVSFGKMKIEATTPTTQISVTITNVNDQSEVTGTTIAVVATLLAKVLLMGMP